MKINDLIYSDGKILEYSISDGNLIIIFQDYDNNKFEISFNKISSVSEKGSVGFDLSDMKHKENKADFYDDDGVVLSIIADDYKIVSL
jgi:hypothetical protein